MTKDEQIMLVVGLGLFCGGLAGEIILSPPNGDIMMISIISISSGLTFTIYAISHWFRRKTTEE